MTAELVGTGGSLTIGSLRQKVKTKELPIGWKDLSQSWQENKYTSLVRLQKIWVLIFAFTSNHRSFKVCGKSKEKELC